MIEAPHPQWRTMSIWWMKKKHLAFSPDPDHAAAGVLDADKLLITLHVVTLALAAGVDGVVLVHAAGE